ncbi:acyl-CoA thioesterase [Reichenbachiella agarivorans]|uniref:Acyl-CoA thioesterase n=1 Tax=Reichenbachiella agarivorans TaxID=2979464 RepID=A0ABY6CN85_9BACT|nr:thioesterase family protein [Reichenbachiella agarivorans]UXP31947.1 acyl-CoA thioesterase [Reichenbachiella agarivorans]
MFFSETQVRVRYGETDQMGYVYYGNYAMYYEVARVESLRTLGLSYREMEAMGVMMPVLENRSKYIAPGRYDELLTIKVKLPEMPNVRIRFEYEIYNEQNKLINIGETTLVFVDMESNKPCKMPEVMEKLLAPYFND